MTRASFRDLAVVGAKAALLALFALALVAGLRRRDWVQTVILLAPVAVGAAWHHRGQLLAFARLDHRPVNEKEDNGQ